MVFTIHTPKCVVTETKRSNAVDEIAQQLRVTHHVDTNRVAQETADKIIRLAETKGSALVETSKYNITVTVLREDF